MHFLQCLMLCIGGLLVGLALSPLFAVPVLTPLESCNSLIKSEANGVSDPLAGIIFVRTAGRTAEQIENTLLHEFGHYINYNYGGNWLDENFAQAYAATHKICGDKE